MWGVETQQRHFVIRPPDTVSLVVRPPAASASVPDAGRGLEVLLVHFCWGVVCSGSSRVEAEDADERARRVLVGTSWIESSVPSVAVGGWVHRREQVARLVMMMMVRSMIMLSLMLFGCRDEIVDDDLVGWLLLVMMLNLVKINLMRRICK